MKRPSSAFKIASVLGLAALVLGVTARPASAGLFGPRTVVVETPGYYPAYLAPAPVATVYAAPVSTVIATPVTTIYPAPVISTAVVDTAVVPSAYTTSTVTAAPIATTYAAPAVVAPAPRVRVVYPRRVYRYGY